MGRPTIDQAIGFLTERSIRAAKGYPDAPIPQLRGQAVAVNVHKAEPNSVNYSAVVCVPPEAGMAGCEVIAGWVDNAWSVNGGS